MEYSDSSAANFSLEQKGGTWILNSKGKTEATDGMAVQALLKAVSASQYEGVIIPSDLAYSRQDSLKALAPRVRLRIRRSDATVNTMVLYHVPPDPEAVDDDGRPQEFDPNRFYAFLEDDRMLLVQRFGLQHLLKSSRALRASR